MIRKQAIKPQVFISHSEEDERLVRRLEKALKAESVPVWVYYMDITPGEPIPKKINDALESCDTVLLVWSRAASRSHWVEIEWMSAITLGKKIIPCVLDDTKPPLILTPTAYTDLRKFRRGVNQIIEALRRSEFHFNNVIRSKNRSL